MSTRIYNAYRCELHCMEKAVSYLRKRMWRNVTQLAIQRKTKHSIESIDALANIVGECGFHVWIHEGYAYFILFGMSTFVEFKKTPAWLEDYRYWNNSDGPENISYRKWSSRGEMWYKIATGPNCWANKLTNVVFSGKEFDTKWALIVYLQRRSKRS